METLSSDDTASRFMVNISMLSGCVRSSRYAERLSPFVMLVPFMATITSPPIGMVLPPI